MSRGFLMSNTPCFDEEDRPVGNGMGFARSIRPLVGSCGSEIQGGPCDHIPRSIFRYTLDGRIDIH